MFDEVTFHLVKRERVGCSGVVHPDPIEDRPQDERLHLGVDGAEAFEHLLEEDNVFFFQINKFPSEELLQGVVRVELNADLMRSGLVLTS